MLADVADQLASRRRDRSYDVAIMSRLVPPSLDGRVQRMTRSGVVEAANTFQWQLIAGLEEANKLPAHLINILPVGSFPRRYREWKVRGEEFEHVAHARDVNVGHVNIAGLKQLTAPRRALAPVATWASRGGARPKALVAYTPDVAFLQAAYQLKKHFPSIPRVLVLPDVPRYLDLSSTASRSMRLYKKQLARYTESRLPVFNGYILLAEEMAALLDLKGRWTVVEGIATDAFRNIHPTVRCTEKVIFHAGTLNRRFGIDSLLEAFSNIASPEYRLELCGDGDAVKLIQNAADRDPRIQYLGRLPRGQVLERMASATVTVNPRMPEETYTNYSFPSKNLECLSSGRPLVAYRLGGIPAEYEPYIEYVQGGSVGDLGRTLVKICELPAAELNARGEEARRFVLANKNRRVQAEKVLQVIEDLMN